MSQCIHWTSLQNQGNCKNLQEYNIPVVEDVAEALGSFENGIHVGNFGQIGTLVSMEIN